MSAMPLNRAVFRRLLADKPLFYRGCLYRRPRPHVFHHDPHGPHGPRQTQIQRRSFFELFKPQRKLKSAEVPSGLDVMGDVASSLGTQLRPPPPADVAQAMSSFFADKRTLLEEFHVVIVGASFRYLQKHPRPDGQPWFSTQELRNMMDKLIPRRLAYGPPVEPATSDAGYLHLGRLFDAELREALRTDDETRPLREYETKELIRFVRLMSIYGASLEARDILVSLHVQSAHEDEDVSRLVHHAWPWVLRGLAREDNEKELLAALDMMPELSIPFVPAAQKHVVLYFISKNNMEEAKRWYAQPTVNFDGSPGEPRGSTLAHLLKACALNGDRAFGHHIVASLLKGMPQKASWDAIFLWSAALGKGPDEIERMMNVMVRRANEELEDKSGRVAQPDIDTINMLIEYSMSKQDPYSAERYVTLGEKRGIHPDEKTYTMQILYRLSGNDIDGARAAYFGLQGNITDSDDSVAAVNTLIQAMCRSRQQHFDDIMAIVDDLHDRRARLAPETVAALSALHLRRGEALDAVDLLQMHAHTFSPEQRVVIRKGLEAFIKDGQTSTAEAWDTYQMMRNVFPETPREDRIPIMKEFFARKRSDMACHVFFHMRNATHGDVSADRQVYVVAFTGFARNADAESLELAHNQLKLDFNVETDTELRNALMLAYAATGHNSRALELWAEICASKEGPSYNSIAIAFRSCEGMPFGDEHAKSIWRRLKEMDVEIDKKIFTAYLGAIARNHLYDESIALVESAEEQYGFTPDLYILGNMFNATAHIDRQAKLEAWIKENYPSVWKEIEALGFRVTMDGFGYRQYNFNRDLDP